LRRHQHDPLQQLEQPDEWPRQEIHPALPLLCSSPRSRRGELAHDTGAVAKGRGTVRVRPAELVGSIASAVVDVLAEASEAGLVGDARVVEAERVLDAAQ